MSKAYLSLLASIPPENFTNIDTRVVVIGCGEWDVIPFYKGVENVSPTFPPRAPPPVESHRPGHQFLDTTGFKGDIYADSSRGTFRALGLKVSLETTPKGEKKKSYLPNGAFVNAMASAWVSNVSPRVLRMSHSEHSVRLCTQEISGDRETSHN